MTMKIFLKTFFIVTLLSFATTQTGKNNNKSESSIFGNRFALVKRFAECDDVHDMPLKFFMTTKQRSKNEFIMNGSFDFIESFPFNDQKHVKGKIVYLLKLNSKK